MKQNRQFVCSEHSGGFRVESTFISFLASIRMKFNNLQLIGEQLHTTTMPMIYWEEKEARASSNTGFVIWNMPEFLSIFIFIVFIVFIARYVGLISNAYLWASQEWNLRMQMCSFSFSCCWWITSVQNKILCSSKLIRADAPRKTKSLFAYP